MSDTVFTKVDYDLSTLIKFIKLGEIGLPDIQRPFVWKNAKVRDLFDSMYKGYPVGYLLFWQNTPTQVESTRAIGIDSKQKVPRLVIVDGQQRLTSLYAVINNIEIIRENFEKEKIQIAFNPLDQRFEVADAAICRDKTFIQSISVLWDKNTSFTRIVRQYIEGLRSSREVTEEESILIEESIDKLKVLEHYSFTTLELASSISEEDVSDVFVRINSKGTPLKQSDFILTLMSVFWDEGRTELEDFCMKSRKPTKSDASPFNYFIEPSPDQLLRVNVGVAFKRARLKYVYSILRGKDLETEKFSDERREQQFAILKEAQQKTLNLLYWHDFMKCIRQAGFRSNKMISSDNNLLFSYMLYLIGRTEYKVSEYELRKIISRWFFMSAVTGRFTSSPESTMEFDLARLRDVSSPEEFISLLENICEVTLTNDFWGVTLPNNLAKAASVSPALFAFQAAQVLLETPALFSKIKIAELIDPSINSNKAAVERHHLFPKGFLKKKGITMQRDTNQIANYALIEWADNNKISDKAPVDYIPELKSRFNQTEIDRMYELHALPKNWEHMEYRDFLEKRRDLMSQIIAKGYSTLMSQKANAEPSNDRFNLTSILNNGESENIEFKSTLRTNLHTAKKDPRMEFSVLKTISGFLNKSGGVLIIGVSDEGNAVGIIADNFENEDKMNLHLINIIKTRMGVHALTCVHCHFEDKDNYRVLVVKCDKSNLPVFLADNGIEHFFIRTGPSTTELSASQTQEYISHRFER